MYTDMSQYKLMRGIILSALGLALSAGFFIPFQMTHAAVLYEQSQTGTAYDIFADVGTNTGFYSKLPQYSGSGVIFPGGGVAYTGTAAWLRLKRLSGLSCDAPLSISLFGTDGNTQIGTIFNSTGVAVGDYCDFPITGNNRTDQTLGFLSICINGDCDGLSESFVLDGSPENEGYVADGSQTIFQPGGWAFQICDDGGCEGGFELATTTATSTATSTDTGTGTTTATSTATSTPPTGASSVLFLPGIQASRLYKKDSNGNEDEIWMPDGNQDVEQLAMNNFGESQYRVYTKDILTTVPILGTVYGSFADYMNELQQTGVIADWTPFAYDWRRSVNDTAFIGGQYEEGLRDIAAEIEYLASSSFSGKVTVVGHSNGGLLAKAVMNRLTAEGKSGLVDKVILLASPQLGTPKAIGTILHGFDQEKLGGWLIDDVIARDVIQNMPGAYGLVTSQEYFNNVQTKPIVFEQSNATLNFRNVYGDSIDSESELVRFMTGISDGRSNAISIDDALRANQIMLTSQLQLHSNQLDNWVAPSSTEVIEIVGTGLDTVSGFEYKTIREEVCPILGVLGCEIKEFYKPFPIISSKGDKTVVTSSAEAYKGPKRKYYIDLKAVKANGGNEEHYNITENKSIQKLMKNILQATSSEIDFISESSQNDNVNRSLLGAHSPVSIEVTNNTGQRVGRTAAGKEENIQGSSYFELGTSKYIIIPNEDAYNVNIKGTGRGGLVFTIDVLSTDEQVRQVTLSIASITPSTTISTTYKNNQLQNLKIDSNGDGKIDKILTPDGIDVTPVVTYKTLRDKINEISLSRTRKLPLLILLEVAYEFDKRSQFRSEVIALDKLSLLLNTYYKQRWISKTQYEELITIIDKLK